MPLDPKILLLSVRPRFAELLLDGTKTVELRRIRPAVREGDLVILYASSPVRRMMGSCVVSAVDVRTPAELWSMHKSRVGLTRSEYDSYFEGSEQAVGISVRDARPARRSLTLSEMRLLFPGFMPPQSFRYLTSDELARLDGDEPFSKSLAG